MRENIETLVANIRYQHRQRCYAMEQRKRSNLALGSFLRMALGWSLALPEAERNKIKKQAAGLVEVGEAEKKHNEKQAKRLQKAGVDDFEVEVFVIDEPAYEEWRDIIEASLAAREPFERVEKTAHKEMGRLAEMLPVWEWGKNIRGFGVVSLAVIVAEAGDLSNYPKKGHLWKRMGLAVIDGVRQGGLRKGAPKEAWIKHGYNGHRRSRVWSIGEALIKNNADGPYRSVYLKRKAVEYAKAVAEGLIPASSSAGTVESWGKLGLALALVKKLDPAKHRSAGHMTRRAQRHMEKLLLRDLWREWRASLVMSEKAKPRLPAFLHEESPSVEV